MSTRAGWTTLSALVLLAMLAVACGGGRTNADDEFVFGVVLAGPHNDQGWSEAHYMGARYVEQKLDGIRFIYQDHVNPTDRPNTTLEQVVDDMINDGAQMIMTTSEAFAADAGVIAAKYPDIPFVQISGDHAKTGIAPANAANYMTQMEYGKAIGGCAAALKTQTRTIGYLGPLVNDQTRRLAAAAYLGARDCYRTYRGGNPNDLRFVVTWIGYWFNIPGVTLDPNDIANDMFNARADVIISGIDTTEGLLVAGQRADRGESVWAVPFNNEDACNVRPEICLGVPYHNWGPAYLRFVETARAGKHAQFWEWEAPNWPAINDRDRSAVGYQMGDGLSSEEVAILEQYIRALGSGQAKLFTGPLRLQDGTLYLADGEDAALDQIWYLPQLLQGMEGASN